MTNYTNTRNSVPMTREMAERLQRGDRIFSRYGVGGVEAGTEYAFVSLDGAYVQSRRTEGMTPGRLGPQRPYAEWLVDNAVVFQRMGGASEPPTERGEHLGAVDMDGNAIHVGDLLQVYLPIDGVDVDGRQWRAARFEGGYIRATREDGTGNYAFTPRAIRLMPITPTVAASALEPPQFTHFEAGDIVECTAHAVAGYTAPEGSRWWISREMRTPMRIGEGGVVYAWYIDSPTRHIDDQTRRRSREIIDLRHARIVGRQGMHQDRQPYQVGDVVRCDTQHAATNVGTLWTITREMRDDRLLARLIRGTAETGWDCLTSDQAATGEWNLQTRYISLVAPARGAVVAPAAPVVAEAPVAETPRTAEELAAALVEKEALLERVRDRMFREAERRGWCTEFEQIARDVGLDWDRRSEWDVMVQLPAIRVRVPLSSSADEARGRLTVGQIRAALTAHTIRVSDITIPTDPVRVTR